MVQPEYSLRVLLEETELSIDRITVVPTAQIRFFSMSASLIMLVASLFIICSIAIVAISRDEFRETQSVLEKEEEENSNLPQIPQSK